MYWHSPFFADKIKQVLIFFTDITDEKLWQRLMLLTMRTDKLTWQLLITYDGNEIHWQRLTILLYVQINLNKYGRLSCTQL